MKKILIIWGLLLLMQTAYGMYLQGLDVKGATLFQDIMDNDLADIKVLLNSDSRTVTQINSYGLSAIWLAAASNQSDILKELLSHMHTLKEKRVVNYTNAVKVAEIHEGSTPLLLACYHGNARSARLLLDAGAKVNHANVIGQTPLYFACLKGDTFLIKMLINAGAQIAPDLLNGQFNDEVTRLLRYYTPLRIQVWNNGQKTLFGQQVRHAYDLYVQGRPELLASMLGVVDEGVNPLVTAKVEGFFNKSDLPKVKQSIKAMLARPAKGMLAKSRFIDKRILQVPTGSKGFQWGLNRVMFG